MSQLGFHAGDKAWVVHQAGPGQPYQCDLLKIDRACRDGDKVTYSFAAIKKNVGNNRVFESPETAAYLCEKLNKNKEIKKKDA